MGFRSIRANQLQQWRPNMAVEISRSILFIFFQIQELLYLPLYIAYTYTAKKKRLASTGKLYRTTVYWLILSWLCLPAHCGIHNSSFMGWGMCAWENTNIAVGPYI